MATTLNMLPIVGFNRIVSLTNNNLDDILPLRVVDPPITGAGTTGEGRTGRMRVAFKLFQSDTQTVNDLSLTLNIRLPAPPPIEDVVGDEYAGPDADWSKIAPLCIISGGSSVEATLPTIHVAECERLDDNSPFDLRITINFITTVAPQTAVYDVLVDFMHSVPN